MADASLHLHHGYVDKYNTPTANNLALADGPAGCLRDRGAARPEVLAVDEFDEVETPPVRLHIDERRPLPSHHFERREGRPVQQDHGPRGRRDDETPTIDEARPVGARRVGRRQLLAGAGLGAAATAATWVAPEVLTSAARAAGTVMCPDPTSTTVVTGTNLQRLVPGTAPFVAPNNNTLNNNIVLRSATLTNLWLERQLTITAGVAVNRVTPNTGSFNGGSSNQNTTLTASPASPRTLCSYFVHGDREPNSASLTGSVTFPAGWRIAALIYQRTQLQNSHQFYSPNLVCSCSPSGVACCYHPMESNDTMNWTRAGGQDTLTWTMTFGNERDQIRVLLEPAP